MMLSRPAPVDAFGLPLSQSVEEAWSEQVWNEPAGDLQQPQQFALYANIAPLPSPNPVATSSMAQSDLYLFPPTPNTSASNFPAYFELSPVPRRNSAYNTLPMPMPMPMQPQQIMQQPTYQVEAPLQPTVPQMVSNDEQAPLTVQTHRFVEVAPTPAPVPAPMTVSAPTPRSGCCGGGKSGCGSNKVAAMPSCASVALDESHEYASPASDGSQPGGKRPRITDKDRRDTIRDRLEQLRALVLPQNGGKAAKHPSQATIIAASVCCIRSLQSRLAMATGASECASSISPTERHSGSSVHSTDSHSPPNSPLLMSQLDTHQQTVALQSCLSLHEENQRLRQMVAALQTRLVQQEVPSGILQPQSIPVGGRANRKRQREDANF